MFPAWIGRALGFAAPLEAERIESDGSTTTWRTKRLDQTVKSVCANCNNGWMADLEVAVQPFLTPMLHGRPTRLGPNRQRLLSAWSLKTALMITQMAPDMPIFPRQEFEHLFSERAPSTGTAIWLSTHHPPSDAHHITIVASSSRSILNQIERPADWESKSDREAWYAGLTMFAVGRFVVTVLNHNIPTELEVTVTPSTQGLSFDDHFQQLWPTIRHHIRWPRRDLEDIGGFRGAYKMWETGSR